MICVESGKYLFPVFRTRAVVALAQLSQIGMALDNKTASLVTPVRRYQYEAITLPSITNQLTSDERCAAVLGQLVNRSGTAG